MPVPVALAKDGNGEPVQIGSSFVTTDGTNNSPLAYSTTIIPLTIPTGAVEFIVAPTTDLKVSEDPTMTTYDVIIGGSKEAIGCSRMTTIYITRSSGDGIAYFRFTKV